ncbi:MAG: hypothetical protein CM1200mP34_0870 [Verrucomicrobiales bacterium]|nr:MAG: hypothetical protein CM1200mP34_0870 [Verrucomicrobiales bacterium]
MLGNISGSAEIIPATVEFVDIAGLVKGASAGEGLGNQFLSHIREVDAIVTWCVVSRTTTCTTSRGHRPGARHRTLPPS